MEGQQQVMTFPADLLSRCWFLAGPTASGKTAVSLHLAKKLHAEIIAMDSMTLYRGMDIGTAKVTLEEQSGIRHHLIDILEPHEEFSLADYVVAAEASCREIISRDRIPLFVGGTGLYLRGLLRGVFAGPAADWDLRHRLEDLARREGPQSLWDQLHRVDPQTATRLHVNDQRRIVRALEVFELLGQPMSELQNQGPRPAGERPDHVFWISPPRDWLHHRIDQRVETMFANGLIGEVRRLMSQSKGLSHTARQALGYKEIIDWLDSKESFPEKNSGDFDDRIPRELIQTRTRQFAKRQHTWFRNLEECHPVTITGMEHPSELAEIVLRIAEAKETRPK